MERSHLLEVSDEEEPAFFKLTGDIVKEVGTDCPGYVYLSNEVNASVFYNSGSWSLFLPVNKTLQIGMGLVNAISAHKMKAILSHEFSHFSQKSMRIGSYVYNVNQAIFNMLYDNETYWKLINKCTRLN